MLAVVMHVAECIQAVKQANNNSSSCPPAFPGRPLAQELQSQLLLTGRHLLLLLGALGAALLVKPLGSIAAWLGGTQCVLFMLGDAGGVTLQQW